jgi:hypothetical protein
MTGQSLPRGYAVLTPSAGRRPFASEAGRAWASLSALGVCIGFWTVIVLFLL